jgi:large subunit ribosomal protein L24
MKNKTVQARKQRKRLGSLPLHEKRKLLSANLDKPLREKFKRRSLAIRRGDKVRVLCGDSKGTEAEVMKVDLDSGKVYLDKVVSKKRDGTDVLRAMQPSNLTLIDIDIRDPERQKVLERKVSKSVIEAEAKKEEARLKKEEEERKKKEAELKAKEEEKKAEKERKAEEKAENAGKKEKAKVSEKGISTKTKKDWISEK